MGNLISEQLKSFEMFIGENDKQAAGDIVLLKIDLSVQYIYNTLVCVVTMIFILLLIFI